MPVDLPLWVTILSCLIIWASAYLLGRAHGSRTTRRQAERLATAYRSSFVSKH